MSAPFISTVGDLDKLAERLFRAGMFGADVKNVDVAFAILLAGWEMGFSPTVSVRGIQFSRGKISLSADLTLAACVRRRDVCEYFRLVESSDKAATYETKRAGAPEPTRLTWTIEQARRAGLIDKNSVWKAHTEAMLRARCAMALARATFPDLVANLYDPDEAAEIGERETAERRPSAPAAPAEPELPPAYKAFRTDLGDCNTLADVVGCWHLHCRALHDAGADEAAAFAVGDWLGEMGYCVTATEQQAILSRAWPAEALRLADELARANGNVSVVEWFVGARLRVNALGEDGAPLKRLIARTWAVRSDQDATRPGKAFAEAVKAWEAANPERVAAMTPVPALPSIPSLGIEAPPRRRSEPPAAEPASSAPASDGPITTSKGEVLDSPAKVAEHIGAIDNLKHLESAARKHGAHTWARDPLARRYATMRGVDLDTADAVIEKLAAEGPAKKAGA